ncbi:DegT/DnrJ/EryC1/StrS family aminotransferase [Nonomuraea sp. NPDC050202]|uniref:DegT/DnrJ/EryC1/StrS family aminotransferase n=1 Tax=Nonomuraea sp. NPDC050202 TaxID=3155035 RepID=UPI00340FD0D9
MGDPAALAAFASEHGLAVVEDAAQAAGTSRDGQPAGTVGPAGCFSTNDGKTGVWPCPHRTGRPAGRRSTADLRSAG